MAPLWLTRGTGFGSFEPGQDLVRQGVKYGVASKARTELRHKVVVKAKRQIDMVQARRSTTERRRERDKCREALSNHIRKLCLVRISWVSCGAKSLSGEKLGVAVEPLDIRLKPRASDPYAWKVLPGQELFFSGVFTKNLSEHSISTYRRLCKEVGKKFEAVFSAVQCPARLSAAVSVR